MPHACKMELEGIVSMGLEDLLEASRIALRVRDVPPDGLKFKKPEAPAVRRAARKIGDGDSWDHSCIARRRGNACAWQNPGRVQPTQTDAVGAMDRQQAARMLRDWLRSTSGVLGCFGLYFSSRRGHLDHVANNLGDCLGLRLSSSTRQGQPSTTATGMSAASKARGGPESLR
jgi:hypothetical protein